MDLEKNRFINTGFINRLHGLPGYELPLTNREKEIMILVAQGRTNKEISQNLILSISTVRNHISSIFTKLQISNRSQATAIAIYSGLLNMNSFIHQELKTA